jgi:hypothetical protein
MKILFKYLLSVLLVWAAARVNAQMPPSTDFYTVIKKYDLRKL